MKVKIFISLGLVLLLSLPAVPVYANGIPDLPHAFYGTVTINNGSAPVGTEVEARGTGVTTDIPQNHLTTTVAGEYGSGGLYLLVQGYIPPLATITFYVNGHLATTDPATVEWHSGETTEVDLSLTTVAPTPPPTPPTPMVETNLFGIEGSFSISDEGVIQETIVATSEDENVTITIEAGTIALDKDGNPLSTLTAVVEPSPPEPPEDAYIIGLAYDFGPPGATFEPPITLTWRYDPETLPVAEENLVIAYYDETIDEWVRAPCEVDTENNIITASVAHFATFAIIGVVPVVAPPAPAAFSVSSLSIQPAEVEPAETVTIAVSVANTGGESGSYTVVLKIDGVKEAEKRVTIAAGGSKTVSFSVTKEEADSYTITVDGLSGSFTVVPVVAPPAPAAFSVSRLSFQPAEVEVATAVTIAVLVSNTGGTEGSYTVVLKVNGVKEAEKTVTIAAGDSQEVSFSLTRDEPGTYSVSVDGLSGGFTVIVVTPPPGINWPLIGGIIGGVVVVGLLTFFFLRRRAA